MRPTKIHVAGHLLLLSTFFAGADIAVAGSAPRVDLLRPDEIMSDCGCNFQLANSGGPSTSSDGTFLQWDTEDNALMRINGKLVKLRASHVQSGMRGGVPAIGDKDVFRLHGGATEVLVSCTTTQVCAPDDDSCESTGYAAKVLVKTSGGKTALDATGACGC